MRTDKDKNTKPELRLQSAWNSIPHGTVVKTIDKKDITVLFPGNWNFEEGPDFKGAKLIIDGMEAAGDVEVHQENSDWFAHGHHTDPNYANVILHVLSKKSVPPGDSAKVPPFPAILIRPDKSSEFPLTESEKFSNGACVSFFSSADDTEIHDAFARAGIERFEEKSRNLLSEMIDSGSEQTCLKHIFEACGYKKNREAFIELYMRCSEYDDLDDRDVLEAVLWGESGLLPDPSSAKLDDKMKSFVKKTWATWWKTRMTSRENIRWAKSGVRPLNMPERRIAALGVLLNLFSRKPLKFLSEKTQSGMKEKDFAEYLTEDLVVSHKTWNDYVNFFRKFSKPSSVIGPDRMNDIAANVLLPALHAYSTIKQDMRLGAYALKTWQLLPMPQMNRNVRTAYHRWFMPPQRFRRIICDTASFHGAMHLYKKHCNDNSGDCASCRLGKLNRK
ncbi:MAG TPA: hypothetical protein DCZ94_13050 [Lentisphaeria bacterium]|nr:MAG: hypothetical protein A2X48_06180 [Lentisphaerae bacterium GWF2_49_21]HBC87876.1 hypothetical protein [Lentisphaeria bacterium]